MTFLALIPPRVVPPLRAPGRLAFIRAFVRNPLDVIPQAAYEEDFVAFGSARAPRAWVTSPAIIKAVLLDERDKFRKLTQIRLLGPLLGKGMLTSEGAEWKWQRQAAAPMFRPQTLGAFVPAFVRAADDTLARWRATSGSFQRIDDDMARATFDVISATLLPSADQALAHRMQDAIRALQRHGGWDLLYASLNLPPWFPRPGMVRAYEAMRSLREAVGKLLGEQRDSGKDDLLQRLIAARDPETGRAMDDHQLVDNLLTFYLAGHETTARALAWTLYLLARSPGWTSRLQEEIEAVTAGAPVEARHVEGLALVQQVLKESMRLYPPVPMMSRQAVADAVIDGRDIRKGTSVLMPIYAVHRHAKRWERPDEFDPTRFAPERESAIPRYQYMPFGAGPRVCIGMSFAMIEATAILATFLQHARFETAGEDPVPVARVTLLPKGGVNLKVIFLPTGAHSWRPSIPAS
jgi:cytochrome P450